MLEHRADVGQGHGAFLIIESVPLREAAIRLREEAVLHEDRAAAARAASDAINAELEASRLENA